VDARAVYFGPGRFESALNGRFGCQFENSGVVASSVGVLNDFSVTRLCRLGCNNSENGEIAEWRFRPSAGAASRIA